MKDFFYAELESFRLTQDDNELLQSDAYQAIRSQINRRSNPLSSNTDWQVVLDLCQSLGQNPGVNFLLATYYCVAATKVKGLSGLATGLELQLATLNLAKKPIPTQKCSDILVWMIGLISNEVQQLSPTVLQLRELYRCERACQGLDDWFNQENASNKPDLSALGYYLYEHIDGIEKTLAKAQKKSSPPPPKLIQKPEPFWKKPIFFIIAFLLGAGLSTVTHSLWFQQKTDPVTAELSEVKVIPTPKALDDKNYSIQDKQKASDEILAVYGEQITKNLQKNIDVAPLETLKMLGVLEKLYSNKPEVENLKQQVILWQKENQANLQNQFERFNRTRNQIANLHQYLQTKQWQKATQASKQIKDYAISLSPIYARTHYIRRLIKQKQMDKAKQEMQKLNAQLNALALELAIFKNLQVQQVKPASEP